MKGKPNPRRAELKELSAAIRPLVKVGVFESVNAGLIEHYSTQTGQTEWHTFKGWIDAGQCVRKGESGFPIWGQPRPLSGKDKAAQETQQPEGAEAGDVPEWFPVCYLFRAGQVQPIEERAAA